MWDMAREYGPYGLISFVVTIFATPIAMTVAHRYRILDIPDQKLKPHAKPIPYLGGTAILLGWAATLIVVMIKGIVDWKMMLPFLLGGIGFSILGLVDDIREIPPKRRLLIGGALSLAIILITGAGMNMAKAFYVPFGFHTPDFVDPLGTVLSVLLGVIIMLGACNSTNLIDGLDGLCSGVTSLISLGFFILSCHLAAHWENDMEGMTRLFLSIAMFGAAMGFLPMNFNPARIFMGDAGSILLGYNCGLLILLFGEQGKIRWVIGGIMVFALPIFDTSLALFRRWRNGRPVFKGDRSHFYDQLVDRGYSTRQVVVICYGLTLLYAAIGCSVILDCMRTRYAIPFFTLVAIITAFFAWKAGMVRVDDTSAPEKNKTENDTTTE